MQDSVMQVNVIITIIIEYAWIYLNKQGSEYALGSKHAKRYTAFWVRQNMPWQSSEYISGSKYFRILNMAGFWICKSYTGFYICQSMAKYVWIGREYAPVYLNLR